MPIAKLPATLKGFLPTRASGWCLVLIVVAGCSGPTPSASAPESVSGLTIASAQSTSVPDWLELVGTVRAQQTADVASQISGNVTQVLVHEGDRVQFGQLLALIDDSLPRATADQADAAQASAQKFLAAAESQLELAASTQERYRDLYEKKEVSAQQFDQVIAQAQYAQAQRDAARAEVSRVTAAAVEARVPLGHSRVQAPFAGLITQRQIDPGTFTSVGRILFTMEDTAGYRLEAFVNETDSPWVHLGSAAHVSIDALKPSEISGTVSRIVPSADPNTRSFLVKIDLSRNENLRSGLFGRARFLRGEHAALVVPNTAVVHRGQLQAVYVVDPSNVATLRYITVGNPSGNQIEILSGLQDGERFVIAPGGRELAGKRVLSAP